MSHRPAFDDEDLGPDIYERGWANGYATGAHHERGAARRWWTAGFVMGLTAVGLCGLLYWMLE